LQEQSVAAGDLQDWLQMQCARGWLQAQQAGCWCKIPAKNRADYHYPEGRVKVSAACHQTIHHNRMNLDEWILKLVREQPFIIVEGVKDKRALVALGLKKIILLQGRPLFTIVEEVADLTNSCLILTDLDAEGKKLYATLKKGLQRHKVKVDDSFRHFLFKETTLRHVEGLATYVDQHSIR